VAVAGAAAYIEKGHPIPPPSPPPAPDPTGAGSAEFPIEKPENGMQAAGYIWRSLWVMGSGSRWIWGHE
jgi:hypothetical protein